MKDYKGKLIVVDGLDGSGGGEVVEGLMEWAEENKLKQFDLVSYHKKNEKFPPLGYLFNFDVIISAEPTYGGIGKVIREELIRKKEYRYSTLTIAQAYSIDREVLFKSLLGPFLRQKEGYVFQQRSVSSSIAYQPLDAETRGEKLSIVDIINLEGNKFVLENHSPDLLILTKCDAETSLERTKNREKQDNCFYEKLKFQKELKKIYESNWFKEIFKEFGSRVLYLDTNLPNRKEDTRKGAKIMLEYFLAY